MLATQKNPLDYKFVRENRLHNFCCEASDIGLRAGQTPPASITTKMGNQQPFILRKVDRDAEGDIRAWEYLQQWGCVTLTIFND